MNRDELIEQIFDKLIEQGKTTSKADILGEEPMEDKVYTKRLDINKDLGSTEIVCITVTSNRIDFNDVSSADLRINTKNTQDQWCNIFADEAPAEILEVVESVVL